MKNPINFGAQNNSKSVYTTGVNNHLKNNYHVGRRYTELLEYLSNIEFVKYFIPFCKISVDLLLSPLFIFILQRLRKFKSFRFNSVSCS